jgi:hypothetical protein
MISKPNVVPIYFMVIILFLLSSCNTCYKIDWLTEIKDGKERSNGIVNALEEYRIDYGQYPSDLSKLVPIYLQSIPITITDQKFRYLFFENNTYELTFHISCRTDLNTNCTYTKQDDFWDCSISIEE